jgi:uncharacterized membrane protein (DUF2068 family)
MDQEPQEDKRPFGLYIIIGLQVLNILANFTDVVRVQLGMTSLALPNVQDSRVLALVNIAIAIILVVLIFGLWRYKYWAWFGTMVVTGIALVIGIWQYFHGGTSYVSLLLNSLVALYLNQHDLRLIFEGQRPQRTGEVAA